MKRSTTILLTWFGGYLLSGCAASPTFLNPNSSVARDESSLYGIIFYLALGVFILVEGWLILNIIRFRERKDDVSPPKQIFGNWRLEFVWTAIPVLLVTILFVLTVRTVRAVGEPARKEGDLTVHVIGHRWWWEFDYPDLNIKTANELHVPQGTTVRISLDSADVIHSFWVPQLSGKMDVIPGQTNHLWFKAQDIGEYHGQCAEFCGQNHANMRIKVVVDSPQDYQAWVANQQQPLQQPDNEQEQRAFTLITNGICSTCHTLGENQSTNNVGPNLTHLMSRSVFAGATYELNEENLRNWLEHNDQMKPGNDMQSVRLQPNQIDDLMAYLITLK